MITSPPNSLVTTGFEKETGTYYAYFHYNGNEIAFGSSTLNSESALGFLAEKLAQRIKDGVDALQLPKIVRDHRNREGILSERGPSDSVH